MGKGQGRPFCNFLVLRSDGELENYDSTFLILTFTTQCLRTRSSCDLLFHSSVRPGVLTEETGHHVASGLSH